MPPASPSRPAIVESPAPLVPAQRSPAEAHVLRHAKDLIHAQLVEVWRLLANCPLLDLHLFSYYTCTDGEVAADR